jgi:hypothetical protein
MSWPLRAASIETRTGMRALLRTVRQVGWQTV